MGLVVPGERSCSKGTPADICSIKFFRDSSRSICVSTLLIYINVSKKKKISKKKLILLHQIHSAKVVDLKKIFIVKKFKADGIATKLSNFALCILTADCVPILIADKKNMNIAAIHAGWKGANSGIVENIINLMKKKGSKISNLIVAVGPCISHKNYEIKEDFIKKIKNRSQENRY